MATPGVTQLGIIWSENSNLASFTSAQTPLEVNTLETQYQFCNHISGGQGPSTPNYLIGSAGGMCGQPFSDNSNMGLAVTNNIIQQVANAGFSWKTYEEGVLYSPAGNSAARHCPGCFYAYSINKKATATTPSGTMNVRSDFGGTAGLTADINNKVLPDFFWISPNDINTGHNAGPNAPHLFDVWLQGGNTGVNYTGQFPGLTPLMNAMRQNSILIIADDGHNGGTAVVTYYCILCKPPPNPAPPTHTASHTHLDVLYSIQNYFGLPKFVNGGGEPALDSRYVALTTANLVPFPIPGGSTVNPVANVAPTSISFGSVAAGGSSTTSTVTVTNAATGSTTTLTIPTGGIVSSDPVRFPIVSGAATSAISLTNGQSTQIGVKFSPGLSDSGTFNATLTITDNDGGVTGSHQTVNMSGSVAVATTPNPVVSPTTLNFNVQAGNTSAAQTVTVQNTGTASCTISAAPNGVVLSGSGASQFAIATDGLSGQTIAAGASKTCTITYSPPAGSTTAASAVLTITDSSGKAQTQPVTLNGTPLAGAPVGTLNLTTTNFGSVATNVTSSATPITLTNTGSNPSTLNITNVALGGTNAAQFAIASDSGQTSLAFNATRTVNVTFTPTTTGAKTATLTFTDNTGGVTGTAQTVTLNGTGVTAGSPVLSVSPPSPEQFVNTIVGQTSTIAITITNTGTANLVISSASIGNSS